MPAARQVLDPSGPEQVESVRTDNVMLAEILAMSGCRQCPAKKPSKNRQAEQRLVTTWSRCMLLALAHKKYDRLSSLSKLSEW